MLTVQRLFTANVLPRNGVLILAALLLQPTAPIEGLLKILQRIFEITQGGLILLIPTAVGLFVALIGIGTMRRDVPRLWSDDPGVRITIGELVKNHLRFFYMAMAGFAIGGCSLASGIILIMAQAWAAETGIFIFEGGG